MKRSSNVLLSQKVSLTLVTGYLGSGKTTLLRNVIKENVAGSKKKIAILMNEFGEIGIDGRVVEGKHVRVVELPGGCICCSLAGEFEFAVKELLAKYSLDWIVIETTGVAEPTALAYDLIENIEGVRLDAIVTLVDADALIRFPNIGHTGREQIEIADMLLVNKVDLVDAKSLEELKEALRKINKRANIIECDHAEVDGAMIFGIEKETKGMKNVPKKHHTTETDFEYFDFVIDDANVRIDFGKLNEFVSTLQKSIYRAKGFVRTNKGDYLLNYVAGRYSLEEFSCERTEVVFIGKKILAQKEKINEKFRSTCVSGL